MEDERCSFIAVTFMFMGLATVARGISFKRVLIVMPDI